MDFDIEDIRPARKAQVVKGMFFDRRVFLVVDTGGSRSIAIALTPHQAVALGHDLIAAEPTGEIRGQLVEPTVVPVPLPSARGRSQKLQITRAVQSIPNDKESDDGGEGPHQTSI